MLAVAGIAAYVSYWHAYAAVRAHGENGITARLSRPRSTAWCTPARWWCCPRPGTGSRYRPWPAGCSAWGSRRPSRRTWPRAGPTAWSGQWSRPGRRSASWAPMSSGLAHPHVRDSRTQGAGRDLGGAAACCAAARSAATAATGAGFPRRGERGTPDQERQPAAPVAGPPAIPASGRRDQAVPDGGAVDDAAVAAYRLSAQAGNPLSERKLAQMFGRTSRRWARARIAEARRVPSAGLIADPAITVRAHPGSAREGTLRDALPRRWPAWSATPGISQASAPRSWCLTIAGITASSGRRSAVLPFCWRR